MAFQTRVGPFRFSRCPTHCQERNARSKDSADCIASEPFVSFPWKDRNCLTASDPSDDGSKSAELAAALSGDKKIVVCTIQTFPFALKEVRRLAATQGKRFAVIADEAHSSQAGEAAAKLRAVLSPEEIETFEDGGEVSTEDTRAPFGLNDN